MHLRCVFPSVNSVLYLLIICLVSQTNLAKDKEYIPEFDNLSIIDSDLDKSDQDELAGADGSDSNQWVRESSSSLTIGNLGYDRISPKFSSAEEVVDHVIASGVIENLETEELDRISKKYNSHLEEEREPSQASHHRIRWSQSSKILHQLLEIYKSKSSGVLAKRGEGGPQLSIVNPLDVLRQRLLLELARRRMKENQDQIQANAEILKKIGKRSISSNDIIPEQPVRHSSGDITETVIKTNNKLISDSTTTRKFVSFNTNLNKSLNKCQKCKRKKMFQQIFLANKCKIMYKC